MKKVVFYVLAVMALTALPRISPARYQVCWNNGYTYAELGNCVGFQDCGYFTCKQTRTPLGSDCIYDAAICNGCVDDGTTSKLVEIRTGMCYLLDTFCKCSYGNTMWQSTGRTVTVPACQTVYECCVN